MKARNSRTVLRIASRQGLASKNLPDVCRLFGRQAADHLERFGTRVLWAELVVCASLSSFLSWPSRPNGQLRHKHLQCLSSGSGEPQVEELWSKIRGYGVPSTCH